jgi:hypothetical protein
MTLKGRFTDDLLKLESVTANNIKCWKQPTNFAEFLPCQIKKKTDTMSQARPSKVALFFSYKELLRTETQAVSISTNKPLHDGMTSIS